MVPPPQISCSAAGFGGGVRGDSLVLSGVVLEGAAADRPSC